MQKAFIADARSPSMKHQRTSVNRDRDFCVQQDPVRHFDITASVLR